MLRAARDRILGESFSPLRHRGFRLFWLARLVSGLGNWVAPIAVSFAILDLTRSPLALGAVLAVRTGAILVLVLYGGAVGDRLPRNLVLVGSTTVATVSQGLAATLLLTGNAQVWQLALIEAVNGAGVAFATPAMIGIVPQLVPRDDLRVANSLSNATNSLVRVAGLAIGGVVVGLAGSGVGLAFDAFTFAVAAILFRTIRIPNAGRSPGASTLTALAEGWHEFTTRRWVWMLVAGFMVINMCLAGAWLTLGPVIADQTMGRNWWGIILASNAVGVFAGTLWIARSRVPRRLFYGVAGMLLYVPLYLALSITPTLVVLVPAAAATGVAVGWFGVAWSTALQTHIPADRLSRVAAYDYFWSLIALPIGQLAAGSLATVVSPRTVVLLGSALCALAVGLMLRTSGVATLDDESLQ